MREAIAVIRSLLKGETVDFQGDVIALNHGRLSFHADRVVPVFVASNGVMGQRMAAEVADGIIVNACASVAEVRALRAAVDETARRIGRDPRSVKIAARLNTCVGDGQAARDAVRPSVARYLGGGLLSLRTLLSEGLALSAEVLGRRHTCRCCRWSLTGTLMPLPWLEQLMRWLRMPFRCATPGWMRSSRDLLRRTPT
jgi:5,10-methylenetetrahydromethanopterin reductase